MSEKNSLCRWIWKLRSFLNREFSIFWKFLKSLRWLVKNLPSAMTLFLWLCLCHTVCVISTQICRFCRNPSERNYTGIWAEKCSLCSAKFPAVPGNLNTQQTVSCKFSDTLRKVYRGLGLWCQGIPQKVIRKFDTRVYAYKAGFLYFSRKFKFLWLNRKSILEAN